MITPKRFVEVMWMSPAEILSADKACLPDDFIDRVSEIAISHGIDVQYLDFSLYDSPVDAFLDKENSNFVKGVEDSSELRLLWFDNCDSLAPLSCSLTYSLRSILTTQPELNVLPVFIAQHESLQQMFADSRAPFYLSDCRITPVNKGKHG